jgi:hypothetical protein
MEKTMAAYASLRKVGNKWNVIIPGKAPVECKNAEEAAELAEKFNTEIDAEAGKPCKLAITPRGHLQFSGNDRDKFGAYPFQFTRYQFRLLRENWEAACKMFDDRNGEIAETWHDLKKAEAKVKV